MDPSLFSCMFKLAAIQLSVLLVPGENFLLVVMYSTGFSRRIGFCAALGATLGTTFYVCGSLLGLSALMKEFPTFFSAIRYLGALYLMYLGIRCFFSKSPLMMSKLKAKQIKEQIQLRAIRDGLVLNLFNPRAGLLFISIFSQVTPQSSTALTSWLLGIEAVLLSFIWFTLVAFAFSNKTINKAYLSNYHIFRYAFSLLLMSSGLMILRGIYLHF